MSVLKVKCIDQVLTIVNAPLIASGDIQTDVVQFEFCPMWQGYVKTAIFYRNENEVYPVLVDVDSTAIIPKEVLTEEGLLYFGVHGVLDNQVRTSQVLRYRIVKGALIDETIAPDPTPDIYSQILTKIEEAGLHIYHATEGEIEELLLHGKEGNGLITLTRLNQYNEGLAEDTGITIGESKEIQLKRNGQNASPVTVFDSIKNSDGTSFKTWLETTLIEKAPSVHIHKISDVTNLQTTLDGKASSTHNHSTAFSYYFSSSATYTLPSFTVGEIRMFCFGFEHMKTGTGTIKTPSGGTYYVMIIKGNSYIVNSLSGGSTMATVSCTKDEGTYHYDNIIGIISRKS